MGGESIGRERALCIKVNKTRGKGPERKGQSGGLAKMEWSFGRVTTKKKHLMQALFLGAGGGQHDVWWGNLRLEEKKGKKPSKHPVTR